jgi:hypothetical protein
LPILPAPGNFAGELRILIKLSVGGFAGMKTFARATVVFLYVLLGITLTARRAESETPTENRTPVLVELFTSEGCSSCPPADVILQKLIELQPVPGAEIIALEEHVDYWNHDGWVDPFSSAEWTERQQAYVALTKSQPATPELVVDGQSQFVGSDGPKALSEIQKASHAAMTQVKIASTAEKKSRQFSVSVGPIPDDLGKDVAEVWLAVTEDGLHSNVSAGENKSRTLNHVATLRSLRKIGTADAHKPVSFTGDADVKINSHWNPANVRVTVFVQRKKSRAILGAASAKLEG